MKSCVLVSAACWAALAEALRTARPDAAQGEEGVGWLNGPMRFQCSAFEGREGMRGLRPLQHTALVLGHATPSSALHLCDE